VAARDSALNRRYAAIHAGTIKAIADLLKRLHERANIAPAFPLRVMAELSVALNTAVAVERAANPDALPSRVVEDMFVKALGLTEPDQKEKGPR
jgi:hypothetical protein